MKNRVEQVNQLIKEELGKIILRETETAKSALLTVTKIDSAANLQSAKAYVSVIVKEKEKEVLDELRNKVGYIQHMLNKKLKMRPVPKIIFEIDKALEKEQKLYEILADLGKEEDVI